MGGWGESGQVKQSRVEQSQVCQVFSGQRESVQRQKAGGKDQKPKGKKWEGEEQGMVRCQTWSKAKHGKGGLFQLSQSKGQEAKGEEQG